ncbi:MAG: 16S rRNA (guanine(527)-N(7))-methyltransferase RsmG [Planctomycetaceae bacterium]|nr:16S rRNA (guanine(527)-N(7))-methyltransferase RsmG [Planctomycetaceae bacterium]|tara:strand:+ start:1329 stop:1991 length:663 start_codon:yes stop_codon:yes gene_type:complete
MPDSGDHSDVLAEAMAAHGFRCARNQAVQLDHYRRELWEWNEKINLTRHLTIEKFIDRDLQDSLMLERFIDQETRVLDVGAGGGVPGMILSILRPDLALTLSESVAKRAKVLQSIADAVGSNARIVHARAENILVDESFDALTIRAVARLHKILSWFGPHWRSIGQILLVKGPAWVEERLESREAGLLRDLELRILLRYPCPPVASESGMESLILRVSKR